LTEPRILPDRAGERGLVSAAEQRREHLRSFLDQRGLSSRAEHAGEVAEHTGLLPRGIGNPLRSAGLRGEAAEASQQPWYCRADRGLRVVAIETERRGNAPDHVRRQELHNE
jgi:hypothetical protein